MDEQQHPTVAESVAGLMIMSGFMILLTAIPIGVLYAMPSHSDGLPWTWTAAAAGVLIAIFMAVGLLLIFAASAICRWQWGYWPDVFWVSKKKESDSRKRAA
jgi:protein-S-isoprenylcysteine O-methyltransferase Ste14